MRSPSLFVDVGLLRQNAHFRAVFVARLMSVFALGLLTVAVPVQIHALTGSALQVGFALALDGAGMFIGLLCGGVCADRYDRRRLILSARALCGIGFLALALNSFVAAPSLVALYIVSFWDGFFGAMGITALMAAIPGLVGREHLPAAGALSMMTTRFGAVLAPLVGSVVIAAAGVRWNYLLAGIGTLATLLPLRRLPSLQPAGSAAENPLHALAEGLRFLLRNRIAGAVVALGTVQALLSAVRVLFAALSTGSYGDIAIGVGLLFSAVPLGALIGAVTSGWVGGLRRPGLVLIACVVAAALLIAALGFVTHIAPALVALVLLGYVGSIASLLQFVLVQRHTPDELLGRVNSLWSAQDVVGDSAGALGIGVLARAFAPAFAVGAFGLAAAALAAALGIASRQLRALDTGTPDHAPLQQGAGS
ncbi:MAG TPA: enterobactin transporter EntS [Tahibacter sp.]|uniref:enterobactin transporter EntS n=1 Tax=Tahibacter sp. TaxID=2056211 RepID=UPI002CA6673E|nr:enterobactin transporter EntS [Tahibacter sp.]HSX61723.1 enterobactin transporter EntS [Tahibacter sp.]